MPSLRCSVSTPSLRHRYLPATPAHDSFAERGRGPKCLGLQRRTGLREHHTQQRGAGETEENCMSRHRKSLNGALPFCTAAMRLLALYDVRTLASVSE